MSLRERLTRRDAGHEFARVGGSHEVRELRFTARQRFVADRERRPNRAVLAQRNGNGARVGLQQRRNADAFPAMPAGSVCTR